MKNVCANYGCNSKRQDTGSGKLRPLCGTCHLGKIRKNIKPIKTGICSNQNGRLGHKCPTDYSEGSIAIGLTELDHIDGNCMNNSPNNIQELCRPCHIAKSKKNGDFSRQVHIKKSNIPPTIVNPSPAQLKALGFSL